LARLWTNASEGGNLQQSLTVMHTISSGEKIWVVVGKGDIVHIRKEVMKKTYSVNNVDEYRRSFLGLVKHHPFYVLVGNHANIMQQFPACRGAHNDLTRFLTLEQPVKAWIIMSGSLCSVGSSMTGYSD